MTILLVLPLLIPLLAAVGTLFAWRRRLVQRLLSVAGAAGLFAAALFLLASVWRHGIHVLHVGDWRAPFGITLVADLFSAIMVVLAGLTGLMVTIYSLATIDAPREAFGYHPLLLLMLLGVCGAFLTGDLFNLYVWFEVMLIASFALLALGGERAQLEGAIKYVALNLMSSAFFLAGAGILYGSVGTLNMADAARRIPDLVPGTSTTLAMIFLVAFGIKAAIFPLFFWLPASYHTPPVAISAIFGGLLTKVAVYVLIRVFSLLFAADLSRARTLLLVIAGLTMVTGVLGTAIQDEFRRILSFHVVSQIGYMIMGLALFTPIALAGAIFFMIHIVVVKTNLFLISGAVHRLSGSYRLKDLGGLYRAAPGLAALFFVSAMSLAGFPPFSGFFAKLLLLAAGLELGQWLIVATALVVSLLTLFSMTKIWAEAFWKDAPAPGSAAPAQVTRSLRALGELPVLLPIVLLTCVTVAIGLFAEPVFRLAMRAAEQLLNPADYLRAVLGGEG